MARCASCGSQLPDYYTSCPNCGGSQVVRDDAVPQFQQPKPLRREVLTTGQWFKWTLLISFLPIIGNIIMLCVVKDPSAKNFAKMMLIFALIAGVLSAIIFIPALIGYMSRLEEARIFYGMMIPFIG